jgi:hypothetical protein
VCTHPQAEGSGRRQRIIRLLETRDEHLPEPTRRVDGVAGFVHRTKAPESCPDCLANGRISIACETCHGRGEILVWRERDPYSETKTPARYGLDGSRHDAAHERDRQIDALDRQLRPARPEAELLAEANETPYPWERARDRMHRQFDHRILDRMLDALRAHDDGAYRALHAVYVYKWLRGKDANGDLLDPVGEARAACERGLAFLSPRLAAFELARGRRLRAPGIDSPPLNLAARGRGADRRSLDQRDAEIVRAVLEANIPTGSVALTWGLSVSQVNRIVAKHSADQAAA